MKSLTINTKTIEVTIIQAVNRYLDLDCTEEGK
jgi:hypothetical protein